jgi:arsenite methyltransferase
MKSDQIKESVKQKYSQIALQSDGTSCCGGSSCCSGGDYTVFSERYDDLKGYNADADLGLGCGIPTEYAALQLGHHVLDLGSGAGNDCFVARASVGEEGHVTGLDFSDAMIEKARRNTSRVGYANVDFIKGDIEELPFQNESFDVVLSNCVLNLVPDKQKAFSEILRVLKPGGHFCISDVVLRGELPLQLQQDAELYAGCVSGALQADRYMQIIEETGFVNIKVHKQRKIEIPNELLQQHFNEQELQQFTSSPFGLFSITVKAFKSVSPLK